MPFFEYQSSFPVSSQVLFDWHEREGAFERLTPPWEHVTVLKKDPSLKPGSEIHLKTRIGPFHIQWIARHKEYHPGKSFTDIQVKGPFAKWEHCHSIIDQSNNHSILKDEISYELRLGLGQKHAEKKLKRLFKYRHDRLKNDLEVLNLFPQNSLKIAITGASGLVGQELSAFLRSANHTVIPIQRCSSGNFDLRELEGVDIVFHLAGENIASGRWTKAKKKRIHESRVEGTRYLVNTLNQLNHAPKALISLSAVGYYGLNSGTPIDETSPAGDDFLARVCIDWENEAAKYKKGRVITPRLGVVLTPKGGALQKMLIPFKWGFGGKVGSGEQLMSWITMDDLIYQLYQIMFDETLQGAINMTTPHPTTNAAFTKVLSQTLHRPAFFPLPRFMAYLLFGEMAEATLLSSIGATPSKLKTTKCPFFYPDIQSALNHLLGSYDAN